MALTWNLGRSCASEKRAGGLADWRLLAFDGETGGGNVSDFNAARWTVERDGRGAIQFRAKAREQAVCSPFNSGSGLQIVLD